MKNKPQLILPILLLLTIFATAQINYTPSTTFIQNQDTNDHIYDGITITNLSSTAINLSWKRVYFDTIAQTNFHLCETGLCLFGVPDSGNFANPVNSSGGIAWLKMHFISGNYTGTSKVKLFVFETNNPSVGDTLTYILNVGLSGISNNNQTNSQSTYYFNSMLEQLCIQHISSLDGEIKIFDLEGKCIYHNNTLPNTISTTSFPKGCYSFTITSKGLLRSSGRFVK